MKSRKTNVLLLKNRLLHAAVSKYTGGVKTPRKTFASGFGEKCLA
jgi:hypothetical protein